MTIAELSGASESTDRGIHIRIADITVAISSEDPNLRIRLEGDLDGFRVPPGKADLTVTAAWDDLSGKCDGQKVFDSGGAWRLYAGEDSYWFHCAAPHLGKTPYKIAHLNREFNSAEVFLHRPFFDQEQSVYPLQYPLDEVLIVNLLSRGRGVEIHACGIVDPKGNGLLFAGESGAGKTTMARLWKQERDSMILSDDRIILRQDQGRIWMYGTPWHGEARFASSSRAPLKAVFFLRHGRKNALRSKTGAEAAALLYSRSFPAFYSPEGLRYTLEFCGRLTEAVPCYEFDVAPNRGVIDFISRATTSLEIGGDRL